MKKSPSLRNLVKVIAKFMKRYHLMIYSLTVVIGVCVAVFLLNNIINISDSTQDAQSTSTSFDTKTMKRIDELNTSDSEVHLSLPGGRINPFVE